MRKRILSILLCLSLSLSILSLAAFADGGASDDIIILYENDVHCAVEGYSALAAMKKELAEAYDHVGVVSAGDFIQGASLGVISKGEYIIRLQNLVGYDAIALGNHEFDYHLPRLDELVGMMNTKPICCNFQKIGEEESYFEPYSIVTYGEVRIAYVGITTPTTVNSSSPAQFKDENGNFIYTFHPTDLYEVVQSTVDDALAEGVDYVIALSHVGDQGPTYDVEDMIAATVGIDVVLDAHSHSVIEGRNVDNAQGEEVLLSSTGTKFEHIGKLTISGGEITSELISVADYGKTDPAVDACLAEINAEYAELGNRKVAISDFEMITHDADGNRIIRKEETNLGDLLADAFREVLDADVSYFCGGAIRAGIEIGEITFNDILNVLPFNNQGVVIAVSGQDIKDMLEMSVRSWPEENAAFPHVSGIRFSVNTAIPSSVKLDENGVFCDVEGEYRVYGIEILDDESGEYKPIQLNETYSIASNNYILLECGDGMQMFEGATVLQNSGILDVEVLERYIVDHLGGRIGEAYAHATPNITFTDGNLNMPEKSDLANKGEFLTGLILLGVVCVVSIILLVRRNNRGTSKTKN